MLMSVIDADFADLLEGVAPRERRLPDSPVASPEILAMLRDLTAVIGSVLQPAAWLIIEDCEVVGLLSVTRPPHAGELHFGYGIAPTREGRGIATRAVADFVSWARKDPRVGRLIADTAVDNVGSQRVLERNGFRRVGEREDPEDGRLLCWERRLDE